MGKSEAGNPRELIEKVLVSAPTDKGIVYILYLNNTMNEPIQIGRVDDSKKEVEKLSNGNVPADIYKFVEDSFLEKGYRVFSQLNYGISD
jgi:hypothetical protein